MEVFYVYEHWRPDTGVCFYVGKGHGDRAWAVGRKRNQYHQRIVEKLEVTGLSVEVRIIADGLDEVTAYSIERERIAFWRSYGSSLSNMTDGGKGFSDPTGEIRRKISASVTGYKYGPPSAATRAKISAAQIGRKVTEYQREAVSRSNRRRHAAGRLFPNRRSIKGMRLGKRSEEFCRAISERNSNPSSGTRAKMRAAKIGKQLTPEHRAKIGAAQIGRRCSEETRAKMRLARARRYTVQTSPPSQSLIP